MRKLIIALLVLMALVASVIAAPTIISPNGGEVFTGDSIPIAWETGGFMSSYSLGYFDSDWHDLITAQQKTVVSDNLTTAQGTFSNDARPIALIPYHDDLVYFIYNNNRYTRVSYDRAWIDVFNMSVPNGAAIDWAFVDYKWDNSHWGFLFTQGIKGEYIASDDKLYLIIGGYTNFGNYKNLTMQVYAGNLDSFSQYDHLSWGFSTQLGVARIGDNFYVIYTEQDGGIYGGVLNKNGSEVAAPVYIMDGAVWDLETDGTDLFLVEYNSLGDSKYNLHKLDTSFTVLENATDINSRDAAVLGDTVSTGDCKLYYKNNLTYFATSNGCSVGGGEHSRVVNHNNQFFANYYNVGTMYRRLYDEQGNNLTEQATAWSVAGSSTDQWVMATNNDGQIYCAFPASGGLLDLKGTQFSEGALVYDWNITSIPDGTTYKVRVNANGGAYDASDAAFTINHCIPDWSCDLYGDCLINDTRNCIAAEDLNMCNKTYEGNLSEFTPEACDYCTPNWSCSRYQNYCPQWHTKNCITVSDSNNCFPQTNLPSDDFDGNYSAYSTTCGYNSTYNTGDIRNQTVDIVGYGLQEIIRWVQVIIILIVVGFIAYGSIRVGLSKLGIWKMK